MRSAPNYLPLWRPTKSHPADFILKQIINSDARRIGWSARPQCESPRHRHGPILSIRCFFVAAGRGRKGKESGAESHATALTLSSSAGVVVEACWKSARKAGDITKRLRRQMGRGYAHTRIRSLYPGKNAKRKLKGINRSLLLCASNIGDWFYNFSFYIFRFFLSIYIPNIEKLIWHSSKAIS